MRKVVIFFIIILNIFSVVLASEDYFFNDIQNHWAKNEINILLKESVVAGYEDGTFKPNKNITIVEFLKILIEMADYKLTTEGRRWPDWYIATAKENQLVDEEEYSDYSVPITRIEAAKIISEYIDIKDVTKSNKNIKDLSNNEKEIVLKLVNLKIISGYADNTFRGEKLITRAEACKMILAAYKAKQELLKVRTTDLTEKVSNINDFNQTVSDKRNTYEVKNNRIYIYDSGRYANLNGQTLNKEYIDEKKIIKLINKLIDEESYTEIKFVPDKYIINSLNICYGNKEYKKNNEELIFEIKFYENGYYDVSFSKDQEKFMKDACIKIRTGKLWNKNFELETEASSSEKNIYKLKEAIGIVLDDSVKDEFVEYIISARKKAKLIEDTGEYKIAEVKKIGRYTINTFCANDRDLEIYIRKF